MNRFAEETGLALELKYDPLRRYYIQLRADEVRNSTWPSEFINVLRKKDKIQCSTMTLVKRNQRVCVS